MKNVTIDNNYISYLETQQKYIWNNQYNSRQRAYIGIIITKDNQSFFAPLSSYKNSANRINERVDLKIIKDSNQNPIAYLQINNMIPVPKNVINEIDINSISDLSYKGLVEEEMIEIRKRKKEIETSANSVYLRTTQFKELDTNRGLVARCYDFKLLEAASKKWNKVHTVVELYEAIMKDREKEFVKNENEFLEESNYIKKNLELILNDKDFLEIANFNNKLVPSVNNSLKINDEIIKKNIPIKSKSLTR